MAENQPSESTELVNESKGGKSETAYLQQQLKKAQDAHSDLLKTNMKLQEEIERLNNVVNRPATATEIRRTGAAIPLKDITLAVITGIYANGWSPSAAEELPANRRSDAQRGKILSMPTMAKHIAGMAEQLHQTLSMRWGGNDPLVNENTIPQQAAPEAVPFVQD